MIPTHGPYPDAMRNQADYRGVRLTDLEKATIQMVQSADEEKPKRIYCYVSADSKIYSDLIAWEESVLC